MRLICHTPQRLRRRFRLWALGSWEGLGSACALTAWSSYVSRAPNPPTQRFYRALRVCWLGAVCRVARRRRERRAEKAKKLLLQRAARRQPRRGSNVHVCVVCSEWRFL